MTRYAKNEQGMMGVGNSMDFNLFSLLLHPHGAVRPRLLLLFGSLQMPFARIYDSAARLFQVAREILL
jgi:hypothetical protein